MKSSVMLIKMLCKDDATDKPCYLHELRHERYASSGAAIAVPSWIFQYLNRFNLCMFNPESNFS